MVNSLKQWISDNHTPRTVTAMICTYLCHRGTELMSCNVVPHSHFYTLASAINHLGWHCLLEGRIPTLLVLELHNHLINTPSRIGALD
jgi:hypothetical protein